MDIRRKCTAVILALVLMLSMSGTVFAEETDRKTECIQSLLNYYSYHKEAAATDINCLPYELSELDP